MRKRSTWTSHDFILHDEAWAVADCWSEPVSLKTEHLDLVLSSLDRTAAAVEVMQLKSVLQADAAQHLIEMIDATADAFELATYGVQSLARRKALVIAGEDGRPHAKA